MVVIGIDPHKSSHTAVAVDQTGRRLGQKTVTADPDGLLRLRSWATQFGTGPRWAVEDGRGVAGRLVRTLIGTGATVVWVPPTLMAACRASARTRGKSDPIDALAIARAALREPDLPTAHLDQTALDLRLLSDRRERLVNRRTASINQLRWHLHDLDPALDQTHPRLTGPRAQHTLTTALSTLPASVRRDLALDLLTEITTLTQQITQLEHQLRTRVQPLAPTLLAITGVSTVLAAKIIGETAGITRFRSPAAYAMHTGTAPIPTWTANKPHYRLNRGGNRQLNTCLHRIAITQLTHHPPARTYRDNWTKHHPHATTKAALRALKRHLANTIYRALTTDLT
ncbi:IS110 family transposase [Amycolatopsis albispora]|uniref:Transposase n=1 Tax=Amycolatopsis albispora TaxID=1804986 RepID=A0A344L639_9PSEU|nr:IS110 family transposase [Amycolatopsis albispora]AXB43513.1 transposase [Amycolatopsis albispora]AXB43804.1 transposase [Amycolatopsis albispora]